MTFDYPIVFSAVKLIAVLSRVAAFTIAFPIFNSDNIPTQYKLLFVLMISVLLMPIVPSEWLSYEAFQDFDLFKLIFLFFSEALLGLAIAMAVMIFVEIFTFAGYLVDRDIGLTMGGLIDPTSGMNDTVFASLFAQLFYVIFLVIDGHYEAMRLAALSFTTLPPGQFLANGEICEHVINISSGIFLVGAQIAFPVIATMLLINIALGLMARLGEDFEVLMISFPLRLGVSFLILMWTTPILFSFCRKISEGILELTGYLVNA